MSATTVFLVIGGIGLLCLFVSLVVGDVLHFGHPDLDGPFSLPAVAAFVSAFGFAGAVAGELAGGDGGAAYAVGSIVGAAAAFPAAVLAGKLARAAANMRTDATPTRSDLVGRTGVVVTPIPAGGYGEVRVILGGQPVKLNARSDGPVALGAEVFVIEAPSDTSVVVEATPGF